MPSQELQQARLATFFIWKMQGNLSPRVKSVSERDFRVTLQLEARVHTPKHSTCLYFVAYLGTQSKVFALKCLHRLGRKNSPLVQNTVLFLALIFLSLSPLW